MPQQLLHQAAEILRSKGLDVEELSYWKNTSRSNDTSKYNTGRPTHFMHHHTASSGAAHSTHDKCRREANSLQLAEPNEPTSNFALCPHSVWFTLCAGPSNTNGVGKDTWHSVGAPLYVPENSMNSYAMAVEMMNNGIGEAYPVGMQDALLIGTAALCLAYGIGSFENRAHFEWAPSRKIDPAGPSRWTNFVDRYHKWKMDALRGDIQNEINRQVSGPTPPQPTPVGDEMISGLWKGPNDPGIYAVVTNGTKVWCYHNTLEEYQALLALGGIDNTVHTQTSADMFRAFGPVVGPRPDGVDEYGWK